MDNKQFATAVHVMLSLSLEGDHKLMSSTQLAASVNTNPVVIRRVLLQLQKAGLVESIKGQNGGVRIKGSSREISLKEIFQAVQKRQLISSAERKVKKNCAVSRCMQGVMCGIASGVDKATTDYLSGITLDSLKRKVN